MAPKPDRREPETARNSKGVIWKSENGAKGNFKNFEQKAAAAIGPLAETQNTCDCLYVLLCTYGEHI